MRKSDRYITPGVIIAGIGAALLIILATIAAVTWLQAMGRDPAPMLDLVTKLVAAVGSIGTLVLTLANRATVAKTERNTGLQANEIGHLANAVYEVADALPRPVAVSRHAYPETAAIPERERAPGPRGS